MAAFARIPSVEEADEAGAGEESGESGVGEEADKMDAGAGDTCDSGESEGNVGSICGTDESDREAREEPSTARVVRVSDPATGVEAAGPDSPGGFNTALHIEGVYFAYRGDQEMLHGVMLDVDSGKAATIIGPPGARKLTLGCLTAGASASAAGSACIGRAGAPSMLKSTLHTAVVMVTQEHHVLPNSLVYNMRLTKRDATDGEI